MARPKKDGLDYFPLDVDVFSDKKIKILKARYGKDGIITFFYLLCEIYKNGYYVKWDEDYKYIIAEELNLSDGFIEQVLKFLLERSLLDSTLFELDTILTSPAIQKRYQEAVKARAQKTPIEVTDYWLLNKEETASYIKVTQKSIIPHNNGSNSMNNASFSTEKQHKVKESKEEESKINNAVAVINKSTTLKNVQDRQQQQKTIINHFMENINAMISPMIVENLCRWLETFPSEVICRAIDESVLANVRNYNYVERILQSWDNLNLKTLSLVEGHLKQWHDKKTGNKEDSSQNKQIEKLPDGNDIVRKIFQEYRDRGEPIPEIDGPFK